MSLSLISKWTRLVRFDINGDKTPDNPLLRSFKLRVVVFDSSHTTPCQSQCEMYSLRQFFDKVHSPPLARSKKSANALRSGGQKLTSPTRSNSDTSHKDRGAGVELKILRECH